MARSVAPGGRGSEAGAQGVSGIRGRVEAGAISQALLVSLDGTRGLGATDVVFRFREIGREGIGCGEGGEVGQGLVYRDMSFDKHPLSKSDLGWKALSCSSARVVFRAGPAADCSHSGDDRRNETYLQSPLPACPQPDY
jgi:hypothetical protein